MIYNFINIELYSQFFIVAILLSLTPGVAILLGIKNTLIYGYRGAFFSSLGNTIIVSFYTIIASIVSVYTVQLSPDILQIIKYIGALYLSYIAINILIKKVHIETEIKTKKQKFSLFKEGLITALANPKMVVFYIVIWSSFIDIEKSIIIQGVLMTITLVFFSALSLVLTVLLVSIGRKKYINENNLTKINKIMAIAFLIIAYSIAFGN